MQDLKYEAITLETAYREILGSLKTSDLTAVTAAFITNVDRVYGLLRLPLAIPHALIMLVKAVLPVLGEVDGPLSPNSGEVEKTANEILAEIVNTHNTTGLTLHAAIDLFIAKLKTLGDENPDTARSIRVATKVMLNMINALITFDKSGKPSLGLKMTETDAPYFPHISR